MHTPQAKKPSLVMAKGRGDRKKVGGGQRERTGGRETPVIMSTLKKNE